MPNSRDWDQMLKAGLEMKAQAQKFIDFAKMYGAGEGGEGEEDLEEVEDEGGQEPMPADSEGGSINKPAKSPKAAILLAMLKKKKK